jgi:hypothetical protein
VYQRKYKNKLTCSASLADHMGTVSLMELQGQSRFGFFQLFPQEECFGILLAVKKNNGNALN